MRPCLPLDAFQQAEGVLLDVRSPAEYAHAHLPGSVSFPLFSNEERAEVGTLYKQQGRQEAITRGMELLAPRVDKLCEKAASLALVNTVRVYCWRGGMRSQVIAGLLALQGLESCTLQGGYKSYRRRCLRIIAERCPQLKLRVLGGMTGARKTEVLHALTEMGEQILDLEDLAGHRGSAFGGIGLPTQPSNEQLENRLADRIQQFDLQRRVWIEDENRSIGTCAIPKSLYDNIRSAPLWVLERGVEERLDHLEELYGMGDVEALTTATIKLKKRLGGERAQKVCTLFESGKNREAFRLLLSYYDSAYKHALAKRDETRVSWIAAQGLSVTDVVQRFLL